MKRNSLPTQERPLYLLNLFSREKPALRLSEIATESDLPKASCLRALRLLESYGLVQRDGQHYRLGAKLITLGKLAQESYPARRIAVPHMEKLRDSTNQSVQWVVRDDLEGVYLEVLEARVPVRLFVSPGRRAPLYAGASTRLLLAFAPPEIQNLVFKGARYRFTDTTPVNAAALRALLRNARRNWLAASFGELEAFSAEVAAPVFGPHGEIAATLGLAGPETYYRDAEMFEEYVVELDGSAERISRDLGFAEPWSSNRKAFMKDMQDRYAWLP